MAARIDRRGAIATQGGSRRSTYGFLRHHWAFDGGTRTDFGGGAAGLQILLYEVGEKGARHLPRPRFPGAEAVADVVLASEAVIKAAG